MANGEVCCILGICCPPRSPDQTTALALEMVHAGVLEMETATTVAAWILQAYDLAPPGSLDDLKKEIAKAVRKADKKDAKP